MTSFVLTALGVLLAWSDGSARQDKTQYDALFRRVHQEQFGDTPTTWPLLKALAVAESGLNPRALSPVGAKGLGQIMDGTWSDIVPTYVGRGTLRSVWNAPDNAYASGYYLRGLYNQWSSRRPHRDRIALTLASYNAGLGNILAAQKAAGGANLWPDVAAKLPAITGHHSQETLGYVEKVLKKYEKFTTASRQMKIKNLLVADAYAGESEAPTAPPPEAKPSGGDRFWVFPKALSRVWGLVIFTMFSPPLLACWSWSMAFAF